MAYKGLNVLAVVPARGGSKSIPRKNLCKVGGVSLVGWVAKTALSLPWIDRAILSTDDREIADEGVKCGLEVPFMRPDELAADMSTSVDMWRYTWLGAEDHYNMRFDISVLLEPTSPLRCSEDIIRTVDALLDNERQAAATVSPAPAHFTPHKCLTVDTDGCVGFYLENGAEFSIRQKIPSYYFRNGVCYAVKRDTVVEKGQILEEQCSAVVIERPLVNIDEPFDLELAEFLIQKKQDVC